MPTWPSKGNYVAPVVDSYEAAMKSGSLATWTGANTNEQKVFAHNPAYNSSSINRIVNNLQKGVSNVDVYKPILPQAWNTQPKQQQYGKYTCSFEQIYLQTTAYSSDKINKTLEINYMCILIAFFKCR